ncbi:MAG: TIGR02302 family protein [Ancalomicrobiaceae bacterium]|nr:TIGR02302 family protein [Ancalomicrobiaceae bacterium]
MNEAPDGLRPPPQIEIPPRATSRAEGGSPGRDAGAASLDRRLARAVALARLALLWEDTWPRLVWPIGIAGLYVAVSWLDLWPHLADMLRLAGLAAFALAFLSSLLCFRGVAIPSRAAALDRIEARSGHHHRPLRSLDDTLAPSSDPLTTGLWQVHRRRLAASIGRLSVGMPAPGLARADRYGLRLLVALALFVGYFAAGDAKLDRLAAALHPVGSIPELESRLDAWVTPPAYTGLPALLLTGATAARAEADGSFRVPEGSLLSIRYSGSPVSGRAPIAVEATVAAKATSVPAKEPAAPSPVPSEGSGQALQTAAPPTEFEVKLVAPALVGVRRDGASLADWRFTVDPDKPPSIKFVGKPETQRSGTLKFTYEVADDYGVASAETRFAEIGAAVAAATPPRPLVGPPDFALSLPPGHAKSGRAQTFHDLTAHPWAGARVSLTLLARDDAGQEGRSETIELKLPEKILTKPLARALVEQRRILALDAGHRYQVEDAVDALLFAPEHFFDQSSIYLAVREIYRGLKQAKSDDDLRAVLDQLWQVANLIEDGNLSAAEKALRNAEEALRKALELGASDQEIAKLTQDLRDALDRYMRELAEQARRNPQMQSHLDRNQRTLRPQDLNKMLDRIENLAKTGSRDAARQMLSEMQRMLENLRAGRNEQSNDQADDQDTQTLDKLGEVIQREQRLMDRTGRLGDRNPDPSHPGAKPMTPEEFRQALKEMMQEQSELRQALKDLQGKLPKPAPGRERRPGNSPNGEATPDGSDAFGEAGDAMQDAEKRLDEADTDSAGEAEGRALDRLREGARNMIDQMMANRGNPNRPDGQTQTGEAGEDDPLGRPRRESGMDPSNSVKVPGEIDVQRARRILDDIRRRLSESARPRLELDYLERLLRAE